MAKEKELTPLKKGRANFTIIGKANVTKYTFEEDKSGKNWASRTMNLLVDVGNGNIVSCRMRGGFKDEDGAENKIYCRGVKTDGKGNTTDDYATSVIVDWDDRFDEKVIASCAKGNRIEVGLEVDTKDKTFVKEFLSAYDAVAYIKEHLTDGTAVNVKGTIEYNMYNDKVTMRKMVKSIYLSKATEDKYKATFTQNILIDSDSIQPIDKEKGTIPLDVRVVEYIGNVDGVKIGKNVALPYTFEVEVNKENPNATNMFLNEFMKTKAGKVINLTVEGNLVEGASVQEATLDDLPEEVRVLVTTGLLKEEEALGMISTGTKERRAIITKPVVNKSTNEDGTIKLQILCDKDTYTDDDLITYASVVGENAEDKEEVKTTVNASETKSGEGDNSWLKDLGIDIG